MEWTCPPQSTPWRRRWSSRTSDAYEQTSSRNTYERSENTNWRSRKQCPIARVYTTGTRTAGGGGSRQFGHNCPIGWLINYNALTTHTVAVGLKWLVSSPSQIRTPLPASGSYSPHGQNLMRRYYCMLSPFPTLLTKEDYHSGIKYTIPITLYWEHSLPWNTTLLSQ